MTTPQRLKSNSPEIAQVFEILAIDKEMQSKYERIDVRLLVKGQIQVDLFVLDWATKSEDAEVLFVEDKGLRKAELILAALGIDCRSILLGDSIVRIEASCVVTIDTTITPCIRKISN
jgi:hypothetical protein